MEAQPRRAVARPRSAAHGHLSPGLLGPRAVRGGASVPNPAEVHRRDQGRQPVVPRCSTSTRKISTPGLDHQAGRLDGNRVLFHSLEMSEEEVRARFHASSRHRPGLPQDHPDHAAGPDRGPGHVPEVHRGAGASGWRPGVEHWTCTRRRTGRSPRSVVATRCGEYDLSVIDYVGLMTSGRRRACRSTTGG